MVLTFAQYKYFVKRC